eukprot:TRINITY_DN15542_c0_g1::TRINITY_DN15542_c0_g1_i1::g.28527::m.28527 TRINITY_DN15542_c0_g1::TRINITY_DN15542_c0_g1_i1::g.28527  ORF type:complete len:316 (-),score=1.55,DUF308/PF03729.8/4e+02,DUF308/PF03729.8/1.6e+02,DUF308/PF03729.8/0.0056,DUF308/PF03729.8/2.3,YrhK/PF14145.1/1.8,YrhK/PF14145.1/1.9,YrhK/PF14145.1/7.4e+03,YrhK/PF14145.1/4,DUF3671/PF12420.3/0.89,DUF3671/PF12420.3/1.1e+03 TRINITY_DN15542_c0_g1_i1:769-1716(-)
MYFLVRQVWTSWQLWDLLGSITFLIGSIFYQVSSGIQYADRCGENLCDYIEFVGAFIFFINSIVCLIVWYFRREYFRYELHITDDFHAKLPLWAHICDFELVAGIFFFIPSIIYIFTAVVSLRQYPDDSIFVISSCYLDLIAAILFIFDGFFYLIDWYQKAYIEPVGWPAWQDGNWLGHMIFFLISFAYLYCSVLDLGWYTEPTLYDRTYDQIYAFAASVFMVDSLFYFFPSLRIFFIYFLRLQEKFPAPAATQTKIPYPYSRVVTTSPQLPRDDLSTKTELLAFMKSDDIEMQMKGLQTGVLPAFSPTFSPSAP